MGLTRTARNMRTRLETRLREELAFVAALPLLRVATGRRHMPLSRTRQERLCEVSFLAVFIAWERFLESTFEWYLAQAGLGHRAVRPKVTVDSIQTARDLIKGHRQYAGWAEAEEVKKRAELFLRGGEPYESALGPALVHLRRMRALRNHIAHHSSYAREQFRNMVRELLGSYAHSTPGRFLLSPPPGSMLLPPGTTTGIATSFEFFVRVLQTTSAAIAR